MTDNQCIAIMAAILLAGEIARCPDYSLLYEFGSREHTLQQYAKDALNTATVLWTAADSVKRK